MIKMDVNCLIGHWPFRRLNKNTIADLLRIHKENGICGGCVSSLNSIFYNDPLEGEAELHDAIKDVEGYFHVATVNPALSTWRFDLKKCVELYHIKGVRIYPGYHGYRLDDKCVSELCSELERAGVALFLPLRMEDERLDYLVAPRVLQMDELKSFVAAHNNLHIIILNMRTYEMSNCRDTFIVHKNLYLDTSGLGYDQFNIERLTAEFGPDRLVFGSLYPLNCFKSSFLQVETTDIADGVKERIFGGNIKAALEI